ncbi:DUF421 domain-containing protein [Segetibacter sp. 3557_3]|nr:DUF421 domain-containing protein [Segetibacter sp. 3557_3]
MFDWKHLLLGEAEWTFLFETVLRTFVMFIVVLVALRLLGKRGVKQLSVFELVVIIGLGSAAGDPMFYQDVGLLPAIIVFILVISLYTFVTYLVGKSKGFENLVEGKPVCLIRDGRFAIDNFKKEALAQDEFFAELRLKNVSQLGQVQEAIIETSGQISVFYFDEKEVRFGLPIMPGTLEKDAVEITEPGKYACTFCGYTEDLKPAAQHKCPSCEHNLWIKASNQRRVV